MSADRDRDAAARPRNARPRDELGRPLPYGAPGVNRQPEGVARSPEQTVTEARQLLAGGRPFHAHEVFEDAWKMAAKTAAKTAADPADQLLWKGLAQLAVGLTHHARGNRKGAITLLRRGAATLDPLPPGPRHGLSGPALAAWGRACAEALETSDSAQLAPMPLVEDS